MNGPHLPAGQSVPGGGGPPPVARGSVDMAGPGRRRPPPPQQHYQHQQQHHHGYPAHHHPQQQYHQPPHVNPMYQQHSYMNPYANSYYPSAHYQNAVMPNPAAYLNYNPYHQQRSPPPMQQHYPTIVSSSPMQHPNQSYPRPPPPQPPVQQQPSPASVSTPPVPAPVPQTPSSTRSSQVAPVQSTPPTPSTAEVSSSLPDAEPRPVLQPFRYPLPWLSRPDVPFPSKTAKSKRRRPFLAADDATVELPADRQGSTQTAVEPAAVDQPADSAVLETPKPTSAAPAQPTTPSTQANSEEAKSSPATPVSSTASHATVAKHGKQSSRAAIPAVPIVPVMPKVSPKQSRAPPSTEIKSDQDKDAEKVSTEQTADSASTAEAAPATAGDAVPAPAAVKPSSWAGLFSHKAPNPPAPSSTPAAATAATTTINTTDVSEVNTVTNGSSGPGNFAKSNANLLAEALRSYRVNGGQKIAFLEPRGLINTGNMCYMNSVLQVLIFCTPFYDFLDQVGKKATYSFKSETPLIDAMVMFMREYKVIDSAVSVDQLRRRLKNEELEQYGEPFTPEFVYDAIRQLSRFSSMRRGHQQDAEEFLGFLLESLHDECNHVVESSAAPVAESTTADKSSPTSTNGTSDWLEVGPRQRAAVTRSSGVPIVSSPITKVFGGQLRSELRVTGLKDSVTLEPFQPLQLDIGSPQVNNIVDALRNMTKPETLHGDFQSPRGKDTVATKQVFIESLPPVLILHLKRFQFDMEGTGTVKIWKKIGYPLELELPKELFSRQKRNAYLAEGSGLPKYRLMAAVYHHGKNASGGHYTVDLRRQDEREWIRLDDTVIRRVRSEDVAEGGVEEDEKPSSSSENKKDGVSGGNGNRFEGIGDEDAGDDEGWSKVSAPANGTKKWSSIVNGVGNPATPAKGKPVRDNYKDNKVAYMLFYQRV